MSHAGWTRMVPKFCLHCSTNLSGSTGGLGLWEFGGLGSPDRFPEVLGDQGALSGEEWGWGLCVESLENGWEAAWHSEGRSG